MTPLVFREIDTRPEVYNSTAANVAATPFLAFDAIAFGVALGLLAGVVALASYLPARRASRVNPLVALRAE